MPATITSSELRVHPPVTIRFGFSGLSEKHAQTIMRDIVRDGWPEQRRPNQSVYVIRLVGEVAVAYGDAFSPVVYIGEGNAYGRLHQHTAWLVPLLCNVPQLGVEVRILETSRRNHTTLCEYIEADLLQWFGQEYGALPWFNRQRETSKEGQYEYDIEAWKLVKGLTGIGGGNRFLWAIRPTHNNEQHEPYAKGFEL